MPEPTGFEFHNDLPLFRQATTFTASRTGYIARLIEKDYFCTLLLAHLTRHGGCQLVFKGGTCLAKIHAGFYRLSEDLDFAIPLPVDSTRATRHESVREIRQAVANIAEHVPAFKTLMPLHGASNSTQYNGAIEYLSPMTGQRETILVDVSVREPLLTPVEHATAMTLLIDPIAGDAAVPPLGIRCIARLEAMAEKFRAAMTRREVAIRDFYDIDYAVQYLALQPDHVDFVRLVRRKLEVPSGMNVDVGDERVAALRRQLHTRLRTVVRDKDFRVFDLDRAIETVRAMANSAATE